MKLFFDSGGFLLIYLAGAMFWDWVVDVIPVWRARWKENNKLPIAGELLESVTFLRAFSQRERYIMGNTGVETFPSGTIFLILGLSDGTSWNLATKQATKQLDVFVDGQNLQIPIRVPGEEVRSWFKKVGE